jgi:hypothetical protein
VGLFLNSFELGEEELGCIFDEGALVEGLRLFVVLIDEMCVDCVVDG